MTLSLIQNDSNTWTTIHSGRFFMIYLFNKEYWLNEISESKKIITNIGYSGKTIQDVEKDIVEFCKENK